MSENKKRKTKDTRSFGEIVTATDLFYFHNPKNEIRKSYNNEDYTKRVAHLMNTTSK